MADDYQNHPTWEVDGFTNEADERDMYYASVLRNQRVPMMEYENSVMFTEGYKGDENYGGDPFQYIPTEVQVAAAVAMRNMAAAGELPVQTNSPGMNQLLQGIYQKTAEFWQNIRQASGTGW